MWGRGVKLALAHRNLSRLRQAPLAIFGGCLATVTYQGQGSLHKSFYQVDMNGDAFSIKAPKECSKKFAATFEGNFHTRGKVLRIFFLFLEDFGEEKQHKHKLFCPDFSRTFLTLTPGRPCVKKFLPITGAAEKRTFWCGRPRFWRGRP